MCLRFYVKKSPHSSEDIALWEVRDRIGKYNPFCECWARSRAIIIKSALNTMEADQTVHHNRVAQKCKSKNGRVFINGKWYPASKEFAETVHTIDAKLSHLKKVN